MSVIYVIQYLRALASLLVLASHIKIKSSQDGGDLFAGFQIGFVGVDIFFVISGFVMCFIYAKAGAGLKEVLPFWIRRINRILPLYWLLTLVALLVFLLAPDKVNASGGHTTVWRSFILLPGNGKFLIENGWTLSYEFLFYAFFTLSFVTPRKWLGAVIVGIFITTFMLLGQAGVIKDSFLSDPIIIEFLFGMIAYYVFSKIPMSWLLYGGAVSLIISVAGFAALNTASDVFVDRWWRAGIPAVMLVIGFLGLEPLARRAPSKLLMALGDSSYSLYLFHPFLLAFAGIVFRKFHLLRFGPVTETIYWLCVLVATLIASYCVHLLLEVPLTRIAQRITGTTSRRAPVEKAVTG